MFCIHFQTAKPAALRRIVAHTKYPNERCPFKNLPYKPCYYSFTVSDDRKIEGIPNWLPWDKAFEMESIDISVSVRPYL